MTNLQNYVETPTKSSKYLGKTISLPDDKIFKSIYALTVNYVVNHINLKFTSNYSKYFIRKQVRNTADFKYKKVRSRLWSVDLAKIGWSRRNFVIKFAQITNKESLMINIDEYCVNRSLKVDHSWIKGESKIYKY